MQARASAKLSNWTWRKASAKEMFSFFSFSSANLFRRLRGFSNCVPLAARLEPLPKYSRTNSGRRDPSRINASRKGMPSSLQVTSA